MNYKKATLEFPGFFTKTFAMGYGMACGHEITCDASCGYVDTQKTLAPIFVLIRITFPHTYK